MAQVKSIFISVSTINMEIYILDQCSFFLGGTGQSVKEWIDMLRENETFSHLKILYPTASMRPYTPLKGEVSLK